VAPFANPPREDNLADTMKDEFTGPEFTWNKFLGELRAKFYLIMVQV